MKKGETYYVTSDIHYDFYKNKNTLEEIYKYNFVDADNLILAGDISNSQKEFSEFLKFIITKYKNTYLVLGNHDISVKNRYSNDSKFFKTSEEKIAYLKKAIVFMNNCSSVNKIHLLDGTIKDGIGGTMGFCDFSYIPPLSNINTFYYNVYAWNNFYDFNAWNYMDNDPLKILEYYKTSIKNILKEKPKIIITHYFPLQMGVDEKYKNNPSTAYFTFNALDYLDSVDWDLIWVCGHTHSQRNVRWRNNRGYEITFLCNPMGYPFENKNNKPLPNSLFLIGGDKNGH